jgi:hypothetical protein
MTNGFSLGNYSAMLSEKQTVSSALSDIQFFLKAGSLTLNELKTDAIDLHASDY